AMLNLYHLKYFVDAVKNSSLTKSAEVNRVGPSTVSQAIASLEEICDCELIEHKKNAFVLTVEGRTLSELGQRLLTSAEDIRRQAKLSNRPNQGPLRIAASSSIAQSLALPALGKLLAKHPQIQPEIKVGRTKEVIRSVETETSEIG